MHINNINKTKFILKENNKKEKKIVEYVNRNVYLTNLLIIPIFITSLNILFDINNWEDKYKNNKYYYYYYYFWFFFNIYLFFHTIFSTIYHLYMFSDNIKIRKIGNVDLITSKILSFIIISLIIFYAYYLKYECNDKINKYPNIYFTSTLFIVIGGLIWISKRIYLGEITAHNRNKELLFKIKWLENHTFFHYISYFGVYSLLNLFLLENKEIYKTFFTDVCK